jgi:hypothetical protein
VSYVMHMPMGADPPVQPAAPAPSQDFTLGTSGVGNGELAATMVLRGAVGALAGAAVSKPGQEGLWGAAGFFLGATLGQYGIVGVLAAGLWKKAAK